MGFNQTPASGDTPGKRPSVQMLSWVLYLFYHLMETLICISYRSEWGEMWACIIKRNMMGFRTVKETKFGSFTNLRWKTQNKHFLHLERTFLCVFVFCSFTQVLSVPASSITVWYTVRGDCWASCVLCLKENTNEIQFTVSTKGNVQDAFTYIHTIIISKL